MATFPWPGAWSNDVQELSEIIQDKSISAYSIAFLAGFLGNRCRRAKRGLTESRPDDVSRRSRLGFLP